MKFLITEEIARRLTRRIEGELDPDPHGVPDMGGAYRTTTLYCDSQSLGVFHRLPGYDTRKFRLRRYGDEPRVYLERKTKWEDHVHKRRSSITAKELPRLDESEPAHDWPGGWFQRRLRTHRLAPTCQIGYERLAFGSSGLRLTLDRHMRCARAHDWAFDSWDDGLAILSGSVILEFKYTAILPEFCRELMQEFDLGTMGVSKYRTGLEAWGYRASEMR